MERRAPSDQALSARPDAARDPAARRAAWAAAGGDWAPAVDLGIRLDAAEVAFAQAPPPAAELGMLQQVLPAGDLDGDGLDDAVVAGVFADDDGISVYGLRGTDGGELWSAPLEERQLPTIAPLDPDGGDLMEVLLLPGETVFEGRCDESGCEETRRSSFVWTLLVRNGATGEVRWQREYPGSTTERFEDRTQEDGSRFSGSTEAINEDLVALPASDFDADGVPDLLVTSGSRAEMFSEAFTAEPDGTGTSVNETSLEATIEARLLSGTTGEVLAEQILADVPASGSLRDVGDTDGDGAPEAVLALQSRPASTTTCTRSRAAESCETEGDPPTFEVRRLDDGLEPVGGTVFLGVGEGVVEGARADYDADGTVDVLVRLRDDATGAVALAALTGAEGEILWRRDFAGEAKPLMVGFLNGDAAADVLVAVFTGDPTEDSPGGMPAVTLERLDGPSGTVLLTTTSAPAEFDPATDFAFANAASPGDGDADGAADAAIVWTTFDQQTGEERSVATLESARTGAQLFAREGLVAVLDAGDLDGDGGADAVGLPSGVPGSLPAFEALRLRDGSSIWRQERGEEQPPPVRAGDQDGDGAEELLLFAVDVLGPEPVTRAVSLDGQDGSERWSVPPLPVATLRRVAGDDRIATAVAVAEAAFAEAPAAVLARADDYPDALTGGPLATALEGPLLLTGGEALDSRVADELERLGVESVVVLGGPAALSDQVAADLAERGYAVERIAGADRFDTAGQVADRVVAEFGNQGEALIVEGADPDPSRGWPDAVSAAAYGAVAGIPVLLVETDAVPAATTAALERLVVGFIRVVGGPPAVSDAVIAQLGERFGVERIAGDNRLETAAALASVAGFAGADAGRIWVATGRDFPDALAASAAVGATRGVLLLVGGPGAEGAAEASAFLRSARARLDVVTLIGGPDVVSPEVEAALRAAAA